MPSIFLKTEKEQPLKRDKGLAFFSLLMYNEKAACMMTAESCAISMREPCQVRKEAAVSVFWDVLQGCSV